MADCSEIGAVFGGSTFSCSAEGVARPGHGCALIAQTKNSARSRVGHGVCVGWALGVGAECA
jgi:hypothetical protein